MSFNTLEDRFATRARGIYNKFSNPELFQETKPDFPKPSKRIRNDSRMFPIQSTRRDLDLLRKYLTSPRGREQFVLKQFLLQKLNTFSETRFYNPVGVLANAVPTVSLPRHINRSTFFGARATGALQKDTVDNANGNPSLLTRFRGFLRRIVANPFIGGGATRVGPNGGYFQRPEDVVFGTERNSLGPRLPTPQSVDTRGQRRTIKYSTTRTTIPSINSRQTLLSASRTATQLSPRQGFLNLLVKTTGVRDNSSSTMQERPFSPSNTYINPTTNLPTTSKFSVVGGNNLRGTVSAGGTRLDQRTTGGNQSVVTIDTLSTEFKTSYRRFAEQTTDGRPKNNNNRYFAQLFDLNGYQNPYYLISAKAFTQGPESDNATIALDPDKTSKSNIQDLYNTRFLTSANVTEKNRLDLNNGRVVYDPIVRTDQEDQAEGKKDIIRFVFRSADGTEPVHFRAFISELTENIETEFNEDRYVGRTERFVTYAGAKRSVSLKFNIVAFSEGELDNVWRRMNYLTGLAFPKGISQSGFMIPPLFKITVGAIYENQPAYVKSLDYTLIDENMTFDIDEEVPQRIEVQMKLQLLEKTTRYYNSPFYRIAEKLVENDKFRTTPVAPIPATVSAANASAIAFANSSLAIDETVRGIAIPNIAPVNVLPDTRPQFGSLRTTPPPPPAPQINPNRPVQVAPFQTDNRG